MTRFCWRERTERVNWRLLRNLQLTDVVRRGDATVLEPYALHLTFAKLPIVVSALTASRWEQDDPDGGDDGHARNAWFIVRVFQLAMEYLLFLRARDGSVVDSLREELIVCERECELLVERARKWKDRSRNSERQVEKLHQVVQNIAKLLQIEGATPSAVSTIESLLSDLVPRGSKKRSESRQPSIAQFEEVRVCALCGKMFSSQGYLDKHVVRRHPGVEMKSIGEDGNKRSRQQRVEATSNQIEGNEVSANAMKNMLQAVERTLQDHQAALRTVAQEETDKLHTLYQQLHVETQLADEMRTKRFAMEKSIEEQREELAAVNQEKEDVAEEVRTMKEQLQFLAMRKTITSQNGGITPLVQEDNTLKLELRRLEETVATLKDALSTAREELQRTHEAYGTLLKEKSALEAQLHETQNHAMRLETSLRKAEDHIPPMRADIGVQSTVSLISTAAQTEVIRAEPAVPVETLSVVIPPAPVVADDAAVQTDLEDRAVCIDTMIQTDPEVIQPQGDAPRPAPSPTASIGVGVDTDLISEEELESVFKLKCASILDMIQRRADRSAHESLTAAEGKRDDPKVFSSLPRRRYLRSRFHHEESGIAKRISSHVAKLEQTSLRFGVSSKSSVLANEHVEVVQRALHAHLEVLPSEVLQRMVDIESTVTSLIQRYWMPEETSRQQALERLTASLQAKSQANERLVRQAMAAFSTGGNGDSDMTPGIPLMVHDDIENAVIAKMEKFSEVATVPTKAGSVGDPTSSIQNENDRVVRQVSEQVQRVAGGVDTSPAEVTEEQSQSATTAVDTAVDPSPFAVVEPAPYSKKEDSPVSTFEAPRQTIAVRAVKVVAVSPKSSPPKSPPHTQATEELHTKPLATQTQEDTTVGLSERLTEIREITPKKNSDSANIPATIEMVQVLDPGTSKQFQKRGPSSFSAKHPESQLGIVIPSRYDPPAFGIHNLHDDYSGSDFSNTSTGHELRWSSSAGKSGGVSERSFSAMELSEMSFDASIPSLESESDRVSRSFPSSSTEQVPTVQADELQSVVVTDIRGVESIQEETLSSEENAVQSIAVENSVDPAQQHSPRLAPPSNEVMRFEDDDSDIEEVMLA